MMVIKTFCTHGYCEEARVIKKGGGEEKEKIQVFQSMYQ